MAFWDIQRLPEVDEETVEILLKRGSYGDSLEKIKSYFQAYFSKCSDCKTEYDSLIKDFRFIQLGVEGIKKWVRDYRSEKS